MSFYTFVPNRENDAILASSHDPQLFQLGLMSPPAPPVPPIAVGVMGQSHELPAPGIVQTLPPPYVPLIGQPVGMPPPGPPRFVLNVPANANALQRTWPMQPSTQSQVWTSYVYGHGIIP